MSGMRTGIIYRARSPSGAVYIGQTVQTLAKRKAAHKRDGNCRAFHAAIVKYGEAIEWRVLMRLPVAELDAAEKTYIALHRMSGVPLYNIRPGGSVPPSRKGAKHTPESIEKMRAAHKGAVAWNKGKKCPHEGRPRTAATRAKMSATHKRRCARERQRKTGMLV